MSGSNKMSFSNPTPDQLHALVLDYLCHSCYTQTAAAFSKDNPTRQLDADGDEILSEAGGSSSENIETLLRQVRLRQEIRTRILAGRVDDAISLLNQHFSSVLAENAPATTLGEDSTSLRPASDGRSVMNNLEYVSSTSTEPAHLLLNLRILAFSEACRTIPLKYPAESTPEPAMIPSPEEDTDVSIETEEDTADSQAQQMDLLIKAQKLYAFMNTLPNSTDRDTYLQELKNVGGLLAYKVPETSSMAKYLTMERREAVADQINRAILKRTARPLISNLELVTRHTTILWSYANQLGAKPRPGAVLPPKNGKGPSSMDVDDDGVPLFDLEEFLDSKP